MNAIPDSFQTSKFFSACQVQALGLASRYAFPNSSFSASSSRAGSEASKGRLNGNGAWSPSTDNDNNDFLQINVQYEFFICAVATQGNPDADHWTTKYKLLLSMNSTDWFTYQENGTDKVCLTYYYTTVSGVVCYRRKGFICQSSSAWNAPSSTRSMSLSPRSTTHPAFLYSTQLQGNLIYVMVYVLQSVSLYSIVFYPTRTRSPLPYSALLYSTLLLSTSLQSNPLHSTPLHSPPLLSTLLYSTLA